MVEKIGEKTEPGFWDRLELYLRVDDRNIQFKGWQAALIRELVLYRAAMTRDGALDFVLAGGLACVDPKAVGCFIDEMREGGLLKYHYEKRKTGERSRIYMSTPQPDQFEYQIIVHKEE